MVYQRLTEIIVGPFQILKPLEVKVSNLCSDVILVSLQGMGFLPVQVLNVVCPSIRDVGFFTVCHYYFYRCM